jgi:hypothetical protein
MLKQLNAALIVPKTTQELTPVFDLHPLQISGFLEAAWEVWRLVSKRSEDPQAPLDLKKMPRAVLQALGTIVLPTESTPVDIQSQLRSMLESTGDADRNGAVTQAVASVLFDPGDAQTRRTLRARHWEHLIYAYLIENTRVVEICRKLSFDLLHDEVHGAVSDRTQQWLRTTEDLFFRDGNSSLIPSITSWVRPDDGATRRNAYHRMFGIDLNHGHADGRAYDFHKSSSSNADFVSMLQELLRELWRGHVNAANTSGANTTDETNIAELIDRLQIMLNSRRLGQNGVLTNLAREEFVSVAMMEWFELSVLGGSPIIDDLKATGASPEERLRQLGERVKLPMHGKSRSFFILSRYLPRLLTLIEEGHFEARDNIRALYAGVPNANPPPELDTRLRDAVLQIVNHWSLATGVDLKATATTNGPR